MFGSSGSFTHLCALNLGALNQETLRKQIDKEKKKKKKRK